MKRELSRQICQKKNSNIKSHKNPTSESRIHFVQTEKHYEVNNSFKQFCERF
jgi:hypothetical protein